MCVFELRVCVFELGRSCHCRALLLCAWELGCWCTGAAARVPLLYALGVPLLRLGGGCSLQLGCWSRCSCVLGCLGAGAAAGCRLCALWSLRAGAAAGCMARSTEIFLLSGVYAGVIHVFDCRSTVRALWSTVLSFPRKTPFHTTAQ